VRECAEGVEPGVDFDAAGVCFADPVGEWVVAGGAAHGAGEPWAPGFERGLIDGVAVGADLEHDGVHFKGDEAVEDIPGFGLLGCGAEAFGAGPVDVVDGGDPCAAEFAGDLGWWVVDGCEGLGFGWEEEGEREEWEDEAEVHGVGWVEGREVEGLKVEGLKV